MESTVGVLRSCVLMCAATMGLGIPALAFATVIDVTGSMSGNPGGDVGPISGSFGFRFDDSVVDPISAAGYRWYRVDRGDFWHLRAGCLAWLRAGEERHLETIQEAHQIDTVAGRRRGGDDRAPVGGSPPVASRPGDVSDRASGG